MPMKFKYVIILLPALLISHLVFSQTPDSAAVTIRDCVIYALHNQPAVKQAAIDRLINEKDIRIGLSAWLPQVTSSNLYQYYFKGSPLAASAVPATGAGNVVLNEYSSLGLQASQVIYNNEVLEAARAAKYSRLYYKQNIVSSQINVVADVSKAFFDVLLSQKQLAILNEDIVRLQRSLKDAYNRYQAGVTDKTDYKQATISLNNSLASRKQTEEAIKYKKAYLKQIMGLSPDKKLELLYDSTRYEQQSGIDTNQKLNTNNRIEYQQLQTQRNLDLVNVTYYRYGFLPSVSATGSYNLNYISDKFSNLYSNAFPLAYAGLNLDIPIFTGTRRLQNLSKARLQVERADLDIENIRNTINTEYVQALAGYKSNYTNWRLLRENVDLAKDVYKVVSLQYREGIKVYLDVLVSQADLRTAELNYYNALFELLSSKIDLEKALGILNVPSAY